MKSKGYPSPLDEPGREEAREKVRKVLGEIKRDYPNHPATVNVKAAPPSPTDTTDHNGKYFQNISKGKVDGQGCVGSGDCYTHDRSANYDSAAVNKAIGASNRSGRKIGASESKTIHRLLKGRY
jgi:hypothetical protein